MEYILLVLGLILILVSLLGSILPALPGPPLGWAGLLCIYLIKGIENNYWVLGFTFIFMLIISILDYTLPAKGTKRFGGTKYGIWGTNIGLIAGLFFPPFGFVIGPFLGAFVGELIYNSQDKNRALKAATGSLLGFLASTFIKVIYCLMLLGIFISVFFRNLNVWF